ncbi:MAG: carbohydrate kinase family protein [Acidobacteriaceae bacterium]|nr:carbohydrate kinase family protein [Acidobacteriaceae bacterium]
MPKLGNPGVLCSGNIVYDTLMQPVDDLHWGATTRVDTIEYHVGGNGANTARALAKLGVPVRLLGAVGSDEQGRWALHTIEQSGVDVRGVLQVDGPTSATIAAVNSCGDRKFFHCLGASRYAFPEPIQFTPEFCVGIRHYHLSALFVLPKLRPHGADTLARAREAGLSTSFDTNWDLEGRWMQTLEPCLPHIDLLFMNEPEARMIAGSADPATAGRAVLHRGVRVAVLKLGARGSAIYTRNQEILCPAFEVDAVDTTGAGDCYVAGFLAEWLENGSLAEAGKLGNAVGALSVRKIGSVTGVLSRADTEAWMKSARFRKQGAAETAKGALNS